MLHTMLQHMFNVPIPILEKLLRPVLIYVFLVVVLRIFGKRELAQLNPFDLVVLLSLSNTVQNAIIGDDNSVGGGMLGAFALMLCNYLVVRFLFKHRRLDQMLEGKPAVLVRDGHLCKKEMARELITVAELQSIARRQGFDGIHEVEHCQLEPGGAFVMKRKNPSNDELKHHELITKLDDLANQLKQLQERAV